MHLGKAITWFFKVLKEGEPAAPQASLPPAPPPVFKSSPAPAVQLLALLQKEGRLVDFLREDIAGFSDDELGAAVRPIHAGCRKVLDAHITMRRVLPEAEGSTVTVPAGFDPSTIELQGAVTGPGPHKGTLAHGGWYAGSVSLPTVAEGADPNVIAPAQVEIG